MGLLSGRRRWVVAHHSAARHLVRLGLRPSLSVGSAPRADQIRLRVIAPAIAESRMVLNGVPFAIDGPKLFANPLHERPHVGAVAFGPFSGNETLAVYEIVEIAIANVGPRARREKIDHFEFGYRQRDCPAAPEGPRGLAAELEFAAS